MWDVCVVWCVAVGSTGSVKPQVPAQSPQELRERPGECEQLPWALSPLLEAVGGCAHVSGGMRLALL